ncbi:MAG: MarR family winged helix-turn-helix transcriptional regulator [Pseudomonadota bacterium]
MSQPDAIEALRKLRIIIGAVRQHARALEESCGISGAQVWALASIAHQTDITVSQLSQALSVHISTASNLVDKLSRAGYIERLRIEEDRRVVRLRLTQAGRALIERAPAPLTGLIVDALDKMPAARLKTLNDDLGELIRHMNGIDPDAADIPLTALVDAHMRG